MGAFFGNKLSINQHANYVQHNVFNDSLHGNAIKYLRNNIALSQNEFKFNQSKPRSSSLIHSEEKQHEIMTNGDLNNNHKDDMLADDVSSIGSEFVCNEHMFAPEEEDEIELEIKEKYAAFNGILGKQGKCITDYYGK